MGMGRANVEMFAKPLAATIPAVGGLDLLSPKTQVNSGTLQECMNYEVSVEAGYKLAEGLMKFGGKSFQAFDSHLVATVDSKTNNPAFFTGGVYSAEDIATSSTFKIKVFKLTETELRFQVIGGSAREVLDATTIRVYPAVADNTTYMTISSVAPVTYTSVANFISTYTDVNGSLSATTFKPPGNGPINVLFELNEKIYAARDLADGSGSQLYTTTDWDELAQDVAWEAVDMGYSLPYKEGDTRPFTLSDLQFIDQSQPLAQSVINRAGGNVSSAIYTGASETLGTGAPVGATVTIQENQLQWQSALNVLDASGGDNNNTASRGFVALGTSVSPNEFRCTQALRINNFNIGRDQPLSAEVTGIEVKIRYEHVHTEQEPTYDNEKLAVLLSARLLGVGSTDNLSPKTVKNDVGTGFDVVTDTLGGATNLWNATDITRENVFSEDFGVELVFAHAKGPNLTNLLYNAFTKVFWVQVSVYLDDGDQLVYFYDPVAEEDVANANIAEITQTSGSFSSEDAKGIFTLYNVSSDAAMQNVVADLEVWSDPGGVGTLIAKTDGPATKNLLPTSSEMAAASSIAKTIKANFFIDAAREAVYGVTGAGPAFSFNGTYFHFIRAPIPAAVDKPRHIAEHEDHLVLAYDSGSVLVSVVGDPTNFSGVEGAAEFGFGDNITDLLPLVGSALGVMCKQSSHAFIGNTLDNFTTQIISKTSGAIEYTSATVGQPIYADFRGISSVQATQQYGDFLAGRLSQYVNELLQDRLQDTCGICSARRRPVGALTIRNKNQYRLFFNDGLIVTLTLFGQDDLTPVFTLQNYGWDSASPASLNDDYVPTALLSTVLKNGTELNMIGTKDGDIWILDQGTGILDGTGLVSYDASITFNPFNAGEPHSNLKYNEILIHGKSSGKQELICSSGVNYLVPEPGTTTDTITMGHDGYGFNNPTVPQRRSTHLPNVTAGFSLKISSVANGNLPHNIQALTFRPTPLGDQNVGQKRAGPSAQM